MPDPIIETPATPEPVTPSEPVSGRDAIIANYERLYGGDHPMAMIETPPTEPKDPTPPVVETPAPVAAPVAPAIPQEFLDQMKALQGEILELKSHLVKPPEPSTPKPPEPSPLDYLKEGKYEEFVARLTDQVKSAATQTSTQDAVTQALEMFRIEQETGKFLDQVRRDNPEIVSMEQFGWFDAPIKMRVFEARKAGKINTPTDYVNAFKEAVNAEVDKARNLFRTIRAAGKTEGLTVKQEVVRSSTPEPAAVDQSRAAKQGEQKAQTPEEYFAARKAEELRLRGMAV